ncbi:helix-turn-helix domain-containing protein [Paenibacillus sp. GCM10012307]|uniref:Helix-turn-helix transcriptional regulator n=1 Tax=Paenibacillus roseus TaxID=2798579 RepID=A0A934MVL0_9BACL|nr:AraC family transcriptional regulator [Paenibacillus roseus]MBJ6362232.1 helix-turn-helix transcriptional regulator [Paenibacillus roseus]
MLDEKENPWHEKIAKQQHEPYNVIVSSVENGFSAHWHKEIEIVYIIEGSMQIGLNTVRHTLSRGDLLFIGSCDIHRYYPNPLGCTKIILQLDKSIFGDYADQMVNRKFKIPQLPPDSLLPANEHRLLHPVVERHILDIYQETEQKMPGHTLVIKARFHDLAAAMIRYLPMEAYPPEERSLRLRQLERLDQVFSYIDQNYQSEITLQSAALVCGFSIHHFSRFFKETAGMNFIHYVNAFRIDKAKLLLQDREASITDIAYQVGFNSIETFNRVFKKQNNCTPTAYRSKK